MATTSSEKPSLRHKAYPHHRELNIRGRSVLDEGEMAPRVLRASANRSYLARRLDLPKIAAPGFSYQPPHEEDHVRESYPEVDHSSSRYTTPASYERRAKNRSPIIGSTPRPAQLPARSARFEDGTEFLLTRNVPCKRIMEPGETRRTTRTSSFRGYLHPRITTKKLEVESKS